MPLNLTSDEVAGTGLAHDGLRVRLNALALQSEVTVEIAAAIAGIVGGMLFKGGYDAATNTPDLDTGPVAGIEQGDTYYVTVAGTFFATALDVGDMLVANQDTPTLEAHWTVVEANVKNNLSAAVAPVAGDNFAAGYVVGSLWVDTTHGNRRYHCVGDGKWRAESFQCTAGSYTDGTTVAHDAAKTITKTADIPANTLLQGDVVSCPAQTRNSVGFDAAITNLLEVQIGSNIIGADDSDTQAIQGLNATSAEFVVIDASTYNSATIRRLGEGVGADITGVDLTAVVTLDAHVDITQGAATVGTVLGHRLGPFTVTPADIV